MITDAILHTDGGSRGNPGPSGIGFALLADDGRELATLAEGGAFIGEATNNQAEYQALIWGLTNAAALGVERLEIRADSELMVKQIKGEYKVKNAGIKPLYEQAKLKLHGFANYNIHHVYREKNSRADALANAAMDSKGSVGNFKIDFSRLSPAGGVANDTTTKETPMPTNNPQISTGTYTLTVKDHFDAAHALKGYPGECQNLHGHTWDIEVSVCGTQLDEVGIVYDFKTLKANLANILTSYDHKYLNDIAPFNAINATAENLARVIYEQLAARLPKNICLTEVAVWESPIAKLVYRR